VDLVARLRAAGCVFAEDEAALLLANVAPDALDQAVARREAGEPLEHIVGFADFAGLRVLVGPGVFVPRRRTEYLVELAEAALPQGGTLLDLCSGSGAIAAAVAARRPDAAVTAADISPEAVSWAARNLAPFGGRAVVSDMDAELDGSFDVITACPPYVPTDEIPFMPSEARVHEPRVALDGGADGTDLQAAVFAAAARLLLPGGTVIVETSESQARATAQRAVDAGVSPSVGHSERLGATAVIAVSPGARSVAS
jgi:release factor glutamine methyltransferase